MQYLWQFYILLLFVVLQGICFPLHTQRGKTLFLSIVFIEFVFIAGFRAWNIGNDTLNYINTFILSSHYPELFHSYMEKGYLWYNEFLSFFSHNPQTVLIANACVITGAILVFIRKYSPNILLSLLLFTVLQFGDTMNIMRQYLAVAIVLLSIPFVIKRQFVLFLLCCLVASLFHTSALLAIGLYFLYNLPCKTRYIFSCLVATFLIFVFLSPILDRIIAFTGRYDTYKGNILLGEETKIASIAKTFIQLAIATFCFFSYQVLQRRNLTAKSALPMPFLLWSAIIALCLQFISIRGTVLERLVLYFSSFNLISIPVFIEAYPKKMRILIMCAILGCFIIYASVIFVYRPNWNYILPFKFCF